ncbi:hypothetical protein BS78_05G282100 [Paspalum vaginatum]|nr:hypothetical protein BS78_05G282100 [Paspalum vaginatum]
MKLMKDYDGDKQHLFKGNYVKPLRESLSYYLLTQPYNENYCNLVDTKYISNAWCNNEVLPLRRLQPIY